MNHLPVETEDAFASLLEIAANNDVEGFKRSIERDPGCVDEIGLWYGRQLGSKQMVTDHRTPLMVAASYGSIDVIRLLLSLSDADINMPCGLDKSTALHCAAAGGAMNAVDVVKLLLSAGADPNLLDANGHCPIDVIVVPPKLHDLKLNLEQLLSTEGFVSERNLRIPTATVDSNSPPLSPMPASDSPMKSKLDDAYLPSASEKKEYPVNPSLPDIKNSIYTTDEFRMYSFKVKPCSRAYSHDWTECPFVHPGENARRRDPRKFHYSCVPCPDFRKGACRRGDMCEYAHGVFECWLHPAQYRTRLCKDGTNCGRRVCFFGHTVEELRPLYLSNGSAFPSPRSSTSGDTAVDFAAAVSLFPGSPSSISATSPSPFTPPISPTPNGMSRSAAWPQPNVPALHLPGSSNIHSSRLRSSLNARDIPSDYGTLSDFDLQRQQVPSELSGLTRPSAGSNSLVHSGRLKTLTSSNLDDLFSLESSSSRYVDYALSSAVFSPTHKSAVLNQFQQQQSLISPINTKFSPKNVDPPLLESTFASGKMSPRSVDPISPLSSRVSMLAQCEQQLNSSLSSPKKVDSQVNSWSTWGSSNAEAGWSVCLNEVDKDQTSNSIELGNGEEPDLSWVQSLVKESPPEMKEKPALSVSGAASNGPNISFGLEPVDQRVGPWIEQLPIDHLVAQQN